jgi:S-adenosylmethionine-dependent methyltransferase
MTDHDVVRDYYENYDEWTRIERCPAEFEINRRFICRYIQPGDEVLDIGGGPGRYALDLAQRGCDVTLLDLSPKHIEIAKARALDMDVKISAICGDACRADDFVKGQFDAVLLMGPLYHLPIEADRVKAVEAALNCLKTGGLLFVAFISSYAGVWDYMKRMPGKILVPDDAEIFDCVLQDKSFSGISFTASHLIRPGEVEPFMAQFPLEKLHLLSSESVLFFREKELHEQPETVWNAWLDFAEKVCEREEFLTMAGHFLYIGRKQ